MGPGNLPRESHQVLGTVTTTKEGNLRGLICSPALASPNTPTTRCSANSFSFLTPIPKMKKKEGEGPAPLAEGEETPRGAGHPLPAFTGSLPDQRRDSDLWGRGTRVSVFSPFTCGLIHIVYVGRRLPVPGAHGTPLPRAVPPGCLVPVGKSDTAALPARGPHGIDPYIYF